LWWQVDCTPKGIGARNLERYRATGVKAIFQGGEKHSLTGHSFVAQANYETALGRDATRVVSCNTTSTVRTLLALRDAGLLKKARGALRWARAGRSRAARRARSSGVRRSIRTRAG
jgi:glyceraldehyde-3-phosphate dehydrogenase (NAD(P))